MRAIVIGTQPVDLFPGHPIQHALYQTTVSQMKRSRTSVLRLFATLYLTTQLLPTNAQVTTEVEWQRCIGGSGFENGIGLTPVSDGGFVCVGWGDSMDGDAVTSRGANDILVAKLDANGALLWSRCLGGSSEDFGFRCVEASDGSIVVVGITASSDGDVTVNQGNQDLWIIKLSQAGNIIWQRTYGGSGSEPSGQIEETADGGFIINCITSSVDGDVSGSMAGGNQDHWVLKISSTGNLEWNQALGGTEAEAAFRLLQLSDGGFLLAFAYTSSNDGDVTNFHGVDDAWLVKLSATGTIVWTRTIGGSGSDTGNEVVELPNGDILLAGSTESNDVDITLNQGGRDGMLAKLNSAGDILWVRTYGGALQDGLTSIAPKSNGNVILCGESRSSDGDLTINNGEVDIWLLEVDANGTLISQRSYGGTAFDVAFVYELDQDDPILTGVSTSTDGPMSDNHGELDLWIGNLPLNGAARWQRSLGGSAVDRGFVRARTSDGGYVAAGFTWSNDGDVSGNHGQQDMWVVKLRVTGPEEPQAPLQCALYIPTAFSPNSSGKNDAQCLYGTDCITSMNFGIFNRWGNKVFESTKPDVCWDGTFNGQALDPAVFVYHLSATLTSGETVEKQGNITLVR